MIIKMTYEVPMHDKDVIRMGKSVFDGVDEYHTTETFQGDKRYVGLVFVDKKGNNKSFEICGTVYVMSDGGKTVDTIRGGDRDETVSRDFGDEILGISRKEKPKGDDNIEQDS